jgi:hypothetical protein
MNELQQRRLINQYKDYYKYYNTAVRPLEEQVPVHTVQGTVQWNENSAHTTKLAIVK